MARLWLTLAYEGTDFCGWQLQAAKAGQTVQGALEDVVSRVCGVSVRAHGSGRTDSGVHALGQVAHVDIPDAKAALDWQHIINAQIDPAISIIDARIVDESMHARYSVVSKTYAYSLWLNGRYSIPQRRNFVWKAGPLDLEAMDAAAALFMGEHDFRSFQNAGTPVKSTVRTVHALTRHAGQTPDEIVWRFSADGFLKQMVRNMMGFMVAVGRGQFAPQDVSRVLAATDRSAYRYPTAPPQGLCLETVVYAQPDSGQA
ncbi:tRNA pseudouridine38-40 synthase [Desulfobaculum xiamenense]|uniref:tRNA pseudouridine synthase A n=1 Tax=Desulfobaculum xiamenense TaxID=995050 RepID=A0A846QM76_9BACT|nr:tRNA pseudouridine(38-40) synthase TruA [Desulfobaculum xiamenense]NJB68130.1 tRNA pseudouridine38-40 synthase [Desulfobaculum xiamenense]